MPLLESHPSELLLAILCSIHSTCDLHSIIAASPQCLRVFHENRKRVLWAVLQRVITPQAFFHAITAINTPQFSDYTYPSDRDDKLSEFFSRYFHGDHEFISELCHEADLIRLARLHVHVRRLTDEYVKETIPMLAACSEPVLSVDPVEDDDLSSDTGDGSSQDDEHSRATDCAILISENERARLEAAFYRMEIYFRAFELPGWLQVPLQLRCDLFINTLLPWEIEELACLLQFFVSKISHFFELAHLHFIQEVKSLAVPDSDVTHDIKEANVEEGVIDRFTCTPLHHFGPDLYGIRASALSAVAGLGLDFLGEAFDPRTSSNQTIRMLFLESQPHEFETTLDLALQLSRDKSPHQQPTSIVSTHLPERVLRPNTFFAGYTKTAVYKETRIMDPRRYGIRSTGYIFWDDERVNARETRSGLWRTTTRGSLYSRRYHISNICAEDQLRGLVISKATWNMLESKYVSNGKYCSADFGRIVQPLEVSEEEEKKTEASWRAYYDNQDTMFPDSGWWGPSMP